MSKILPIVLQPHPVLRQIAEPVTQVDEPVRTMLDQMQATLRNADGVGLAANQVGILQRLVVLDLGHTGPDGKRDFREQNLQQCVNPKIIRHSNETIVWKEGCLSLPNLWAEVERAATVRVRWLDRDGAPHEEDFDSLASVCWQHEIDHLNGILFPKRVSKLKQQLLLKKWQKLREEWLEDPAYPARTEQGEVRPNISIRTGA